MSRSNPTDGVRNPSTRWLEWAGGGNGGFVHWYNKDTKQNVQVDGAFTFLLLDELSTVKGWHDASNSGIYANEVRDTRQDTLVVRAFKGGELASGIYATIRDRIKAVGGYYCASLYIAFKDAEGLHIGNLVLKGAAASEWMDFKRNAPTKKNADGKSLRAYFVDAVKITGHEQLVKGATTYRVPTFALAPVAAETNQAAVALDAELQTFLADYLKRPRAEAAQAPEPGNDAPLSAQAAEPAKPNASAHLTGRSGTATDPNFVDDIPF